MRKPGGRLSSEGTGIEHTGSASAGRRRCESVHTAFPRLNVCRSDARDAGLPPGLGGWEAVGLAAVLAAVSLLAVPSLRAQSAAEESATSPTAETDSAAFATLAAWADQVWLSLLDRDGAYYGRLAEEGIFQRFNPEMHDEYELEIRSSLFHPSEDARWAEQPNGFRVAGASIQPSAHPQRPGLAPGDPRLRPRGPDGTLPQRAIAHGTARPPAGRHALARHARDAVDRAGGDRRPLLQAVRGRGGRAGTLLERRGRPELDAGGAPRSARRIQRGDLPGPGSAGGRGGRPLRLRGGLPSPPARPLRAAASRWRAELHAGSSRRSEVQVDLSGNRPGFVHPARKGRVPGSTSPGHTARARGRWRCTAPGRGADTERQAPASGLGFTLREQTVTVGARTRTRLKPAVGGRDGPGVGGATRMALAARGRYPRAP